jgi:arylsulfatase A-like enzyme
MHNNLRRNTNRSFWLIATVIGLALVLPNCRRAPSPDKPNILVLVVDALRADHLGLYGYSRNTSPRLEEFARRGIVFDRAYAQASSTFPSTAAIFTGQYPSRAQIASAEHWFQLSQECTTLAEVLTEAGYETGFFTANPLHAYNSFGNGRRWSLGFEQGFREFFVGSQYYGNRLRAEALNGRAMRWMARHYLRKPFFACIWYIDPHTPYEPPNEFRKLFPDSYEGEDWNKKMGELWATGKSIPEEARQHLINLYDAEIAYMDSCVGTMLDSLNATGVLADTMVILTADHGEAFHEHGIWVHGLLLYEEVIRIPLVIIPPEAEPCPEPSRNASLVGHIDLMPTILDYAGIGIESRPGEIQGLSLEPLLSTQDMAISRHAIAAEEVHGLKPSGEPGAFRSRALITERFKLIKTRKQDEPTKTVLFDLEQDPLEQQSLADDPCFAQQVELLSAQLKLTLGEPPERLGPLPEHVRERLRAIGYL